MAAIANSATARDGILVQTQLSCSREGVSEGVSSWYLVPSCEWGD